MSQHEEMIELLDKYANEIGTGFHFYIKGDIPSKIIDNAIKKWAPGLERSTIIGFYDTTLMGNGKNGYIFTDAGIYYLETLSKPSQIWYRDIEEVELFNTNKKDCDKGIKFIMKDGESISWTTCLINKTPLYNFMNELLLLINKKDNGNKHGNVGSFFGAIAGGLNIANFLQVNKMYDEEKFHARQGHGFAAERANTLFDKLTGHKAKIVGDDNAKNGADRIVDGVAIQSKYCQTGSQCINECFDSDGKFRYLNNGKPMQIEVPSDKYEQAVESMAEKIRNGQVPGVTNPDEAENIVRKGHFTYNQARNIAKAGTVESLTYDAVNGTIIASSAFGVTALITFATNMWNGEDFDKSIKIATCSGLKVGGTAFATSVLASQLSKAGLNSALVGSSEAVVAFMGPKASAVLINAFRSGSNIYGAAAMKSAAKLLRSNAITASVTVVVLSSLDFVNIFRGRISGKQLFKNLTNTASTVAGGTGGWLAGAAAGSTLFPGVGTVVGGLIGSIGAGAAAGKVSEAILGNFLEDDAVEMTRILENVFKELAVEYLLNQKEAEGICDVLGDKLDGNVLKDMYASDDRKEFASNMLIPIIEKTVRNRRRIKVPSDEQISKSLITVLEEISDNCA